MGNKETWIKNVLTTEVKYIISISLFVVGVVGPYYSIKQDIALIKQNHFAHMETMQRDIQKLDEEQKELREISVKLMQTIAERLPKQ